MLPLKDHNPTRTPPIVTMLLMAACIVIFVFVQPHDSQVHDAEFTFGNAAIPCEVVHNRPLTEEELTKTLVGEGDASACDPTPEGPAAFPDKQPMLALLYSMFLHGSVLHLAGNMLFLWIFGNNIEDAVGKILYLVFYLASGLVATLAHIALDPQSTIPLVGASGAIAGVMGAYLVLYPNAKIRTVIVLGVFFLLRDVRAKWLLGFWFLTQFIIDASAGVAWMAHVGGFVFGVLAGAVWRVITPPDRQLARAWD